MAAQTNTFYASPPIASFTATVATISGMSTYHRFIAGPASPGQAGYQGLYIYQSAGTYRWLRNEALRVDASTPTAYTYVVMADDPAYLTM